MNYENTDLEELYENHMFPVRGKSTPNKTPNELRKEQSIKVVNDYHRLIRTISILTQILKEQDVDQKIIDKLIDEENVLKAREADLYNYIKYFAE